jgi:hypothetical protein
MASVLITAKRSCDSFEDSTSLISKRPRRDPTETESNATSVSLLESSPVGQSKEHSTEQTPEDEERLAHTVWFVEASYHDFPDNCNLSELFSTSKCRKGPLFGRYDYRRWAINMRTIFQLNGLMQVVEGKLLVKEPLSSPLRKQLCRLQFIAKNLISINLPESNRKTVWDAERSHEAWEKLREIYQLSPHELSLEGWSIIKEKKITQCSSADEYISTLIDAWRQVCMDRDDLYQQTQPMLCTAFLHGLDGYQWASWKNNLINLDSPETDISKLSAKVRDLDPLYRRTPVRNPLLK